MKEHAMLMTPENVVALQRKISPKHQTRRADARLANVNNDPDNWMVEPFGLGYTFESKRDIRFSPYIEPKWKVGDHLWIKEPWLQDAIGNYFYKSHPQEDSDSGFWHNAMFMPRRAARLVYEVTEVRLERLNDITEADAVAEGLKWESPTWGVPGLASSWNADPRQAYFALWRSIAGKKKFAACPNPWVWVITFREIA